MAQLNQKKQEILQSKNDRVKESFNNELERLRKRKAQFRKELTALDHGGNHFENRRIPLASRPSEKTAKLSKKRKENAKKPSLSATPGPHIKIAPIRDSKGERLTFVIRIEKTPNQVRSLGFDIYFNPKTLKYSGYTSGSLVKITFNVIGEQNCQLPLSVLKDDIAGWTTDPGQFTYKATGDAIFVDCGGGNCGGKSPCYASIEEAISGAENEDTIRIAQGICSEAVFMDEARELLLEGGWDSEFSTGQTGYTFINGLTIGNGKIIPSNLVMAP